MNTPSAISRMIKKVTVEPAEPVSATETESNSYTMSVRFGTINYVIMAKLNPTQASDQNLLTELARRAIGRFIYQIFGERKIINEEFWDGYLIEYPLRRDFGFKTDMFPQTIRRAIEVCDDLLQKDLGDRKISNLLNDADDIKRAEDTSFYVDLLVKESDENFYGRRIYKAVHPRTFVVTGYKTENYWYNREEEVILLEPGEGLGDVATLEEAERLGSDWLQKLGIDPDDVSHFIRILERSDNGVITSEHVYSAAEFEFAHKSPDEQVASRKKLKDAIVANSEKYRALENKPEVKVTFDGLTGYDDDTRYRMYIGFSKAITNTLADVGGGRAGNGAEDQPDFLVKALPHYYTLGTSKAVVKKYLMSLIETSIRIMDYDVKTVETQAREIAILHALSIARENIDKDNSLSDEEAQKAIDNLEAVEKDYVKDTALKVLRKDRSYVPTVEEDAAVDRFLASTNLWFKKNPSDVQI